jgi:hypothetical protein
MKDGLKPFSRVVYEAFAPEERAELFRPPISGDQKAEFLESHSVASSQDHGPFMRRIAESTHHGSFAVLALVRGN